ncbi:protein translocase subunit secY/sec61 alpha [Clostridium sp. USBA 49]|uniref:preprotein translocase subunit SecY n=1 Tax=Clostridium TaxID=1485 RepID=UPI00099A5FA3|nr:MULTISPECIES: preprotein translocase subunit SecY [Clostridium]SKA82254.1 protein translocase subunit secY/sec61 alpha [Clostridium sp. USBA 49]
MLSTLRNAWRTPELRKRILWTLFLVAIYRMGNSILVPGVDTNVLKNMATSGTLFGFYDLISGGAFSKFNIFALGVVPYINASIIIQLLTVAIPYLEQLSKEGEEGRKKLQNYTRYASIAFAILQSYTIYVIIWNTNALKDTSKLTMFIIMLTVTTASIFLMWLGDQITVKGIGNGISLIIFINIISRIPFTIYQIVGLQSMEQVNIVEVIIFIAVAAALLIVVTIMSLAERRIPVQYAGKTVGNKTFKGQSTHIPINLNASGVIAIIFASSVMQFPATIAQLFPNSKIFRAITSSDYSPFKPNTWLYALVFFLLILFFSWFYTQITFKPDEMAENMHKSSGFIPGIRPGEYTAKYIEKVLTKVSLLGGAFAAIIAVFPIIVEGYTKFKGISFGGTSLLILVGVALEIVRQLESQLVMRHYQGFLK